MAQAGGRGGGTIAQQGEQQVGLWPYTLSLPISVTDLDLDDTVTVTASESDPDIVGMVLRIRELVQGSQLTARRLSCEVTAR